MVFIGAGLEKSGELNYIPLLCGRTVVGSIYGGVRTHTDLPSIVEKCVNKVHSSLLNKSISNIDSLNYHFIQLYFHFLFFFNLFSVMEQEIDLDELITHEVSLSEINKGFEYMKEPNSVKVVIKF